MNSFQALRCRRMMNVWHWPHLSSKGLLSAWFDARQQDRHNSPARKFDARQARARQAQPGTLKGSTQLQTQPED